jgi:DNA ligase D-like protein (predicted 3'-phosphoesterase)
MPKHTLAPYKARRAKTETPEPKARVAKKHTSHTPIFVVQKHDASHLHYDLRLEIGGVLVSWAIPKGPPTKIGEKRLALQTEDHPMEYATFEGTIPEGSYGAGTVEIWDHGTFTTVRENNGKPVPLGQCLKEGRFEVKFEGKRLHGPYALIRTKMGGKENAWLIFKVKA